MTQISLVDVKKCVTVEPILKALVSKDNYLQTLIIPKLNMSEESNNILCEFIKQRSVLRTLDISWNSMVASQVKMLFRALSKNQQLESCNLSMISVNENMNIMKLKEFIRENHRLLDINLSGMFKTAKHVKGIIKTIKKQPTVLALHLSNTPIIEEDLRLQSYIRAKLGMSEMIKRPKNSIESRKRLNKLISHNWVLKDKLNIQANQEETATEFFKCQQTSEPASTQLLVLQRTIDLKSSSGNM